MNKTEFAKLAVAIKAAYPTSKILADDAAMDVWYRALRDLDYQNASVAVLEHMNTSPYPPTIAEIRKNCAKQKVFLPDWGDAWGQLQLAIRKFGFYRELEALESMDEITRETVKRMGFRSLCTIDMSDEATHRAQFRDIYNAIGNRRMEQAQLSPEVLTAKDAARMRHIESRSAVPSVLVDHSESRKQLEEQRADPSHIDEVIRRSGLRGYGKEIASES